MYYVYQINEFIYNLSSYIFNKYLMNKSTEKLRKKTIRET